MLCAAACNEGEINEIKKTLRRQASTKLTTLNNTDEKFN